MLRLFLIMLLSIYFYPTGAQDAVGIGGEESTPQTAADQCQEFLVRTRSGLVEQLAEVISNAQFTENCLWGRVQNCQPDRETALSELQTLQEVRNDIGAADISIEFGNRDYILLGNINRGLSNETNRSIERLSEAERNRVWNRFETFQQNYIQNWLTTGHSVQSQRCLLQQDGQFVLNRQREGSHMFVPELRAEIPREHRNSCHNFWIHTREAPYANMMLRNYRQQLPTQQEEATNNRAPWLQFVSTRIDNKSRPERIRIAAQAHNRYISELQKFHRWLSRLPNNDLSKILSMGVVQEQLGGQRFCQGYNDQSWAELAREIGLMLIPGWGAFDISVFQIPQNNRAFIAGFTGIGATQRANSNLQQEALANAIFAPFQAAAESVVVARVLGPLAMRSLQALRRGASAANRIRLDFQYGINVDGSRVTFFLTRRSKEHIDEHIIESQQVLDTMTRFEEMDQLGRAPNNREIQEFYSELQSVHRGRLGNSTSIIGRDIRREVFDNTENLSPISSERITNGTGEAADRITLQHIDEAGEPTQFMLLRCASDTCNAGSYTVSRGEVLSFYPTCGPTVFFIPSRERMVSCSGGPPLVGAGNWRQRCREFLRRSRRRCN